MEVEITAHGFVQAIQKIALGFTYLGSSAVSRGGMSNNINVKHDHSISATATSGFVGLRLRLSRRHKTWMERKGKGRSGSYCWVGSERGQHNRLNGFNESLWPVIFLDAILVLATHATRLGEYSAFSGHSSPF